MHTTQSKGRVAEAGIQCEQHCVAKARNCTSRGAEEYTNTRDLHSGSEAQDRRGVQKPWFQPGPHRHLQQWLQEAIILHTFRVQPGLNNYPSHVEV